MSARSESSLLDTTETNQQSALPSSYRAYLLVHRPDLMCLAGEFLRENGVPEDSFRASRLKHCRTRAYFEAHDDTRMVRVSSNHCRDRWCPLCARSRALQIGASLLDWLRTVEAPKLLTLTLRHTTAPLADQLDALLKHRKNLMRRPLLRRAWKGGVWVIQITYNGVTGCWHPHLHILLDGGFVLHATIVKLWREITHGSSVVDVRTVRSAPYAANYVARYVSRPVCPEDLPRPLWPAIWCALTGRHLFGTWGTARVAHALKPVPPERKGWKTLGGFSIIIALAPTCCDAQVIVDAWRFHQPLPWAPNLAGIDDPTAQQLRETEPDPPPQQLAMEYN